MLLFKLAIRSFFHNIKQYLIFIISSVILFSLNFIFISILNNKDLTNGPNGFVLKDTMKIGLIFILIISVVFIFYSNNFLMKKRDHEFGIYNILGLTKHNLYLILIIQNVIIYLLNIFLGSIIGLTFIKLSFSILQKLIGISSIQQSGIVSSISYVILLFAILYFCLIIYDWKRIKNMQPIELLKSSVTFEKEPKSNYLSGTLGIILLIIGYYLSIKTEPNTGSIFKFILATILVVIGTYLIFIAGSIILLKLLKNNKNIYYKPNNFIPISGMLYRMKTNGAGLATICLLCTSILVALISSVSLYLGQQNLIKQWNPYEIMITTSHKTINKDLIYRDAKHCNVKVDHINKLESTTPSIGSINNNSFVTNKVNKASLGLYTLTVDNYNQLENKHITLKNNNVLAYSPDDISQLKKLTINNHTYKINPIKKFNMSFNYQHTTFKPIFLIVKNEEIAKSINNTPWIYTYGFNISGSDKNKTKFSNQLQKDLKIDNGLYSSKIKMQSFFKTTFGSLLFVGMLIGFIMIIATGLIIYYKQLSEGLADKENFKTMRKVGLSNRETKHAIHNQMLLIFSLPIIGATINILFALPAIKSVLSIFSMYNKNILINVSLVTTISLIIIYSIFYLFTTKIYNNIINET